MRVLWFTYIELPAVARHFSRPARLAGGWMEGLRLALQDAEPLELAVAAPGRVPYEPFDEEGVRYFHLPAPPAVDGLRAVAKHWKHGVSDGPLLEEASKTVASFRPDLIHLHGSEGPLGLLAATVEQPVLLSLQGLLMVCERFYFAGLPAGEIVRDALSVHFLKGEGLIHGRWKMRAAAHRELQILQSCHYFAGRTDWGKAVVDVISPGGRHYWAGEVLRPEFYAGRWAPDPDPAAPFRIYTTGSDAPFKGIVNLLEAVALLRRHTRRPVELRVSGDLMSTSMHPVVERAVERLRLDGAVTLLGPLAPMDLIAELQAASVYAHPSLVDNSPNSLAEAQLMGVPCVASAAGGIPSMITHGVDGLLCAPNDIWDLAGKIAAIEADAGLARRLGEAAGDTARRRHCPQTIAADTMRMYTDVIQRHQAGER